MNVAVDAARGDDHALAGNDLGGRTNDDIDAGLNVGIPGLADAGDAASCVGVPTPKVDMLAFGLGSGIAGLAGCALSQIGNVGPDLGQSYIVDSFMVVVLGGVGQLAGTVYAALGLGFASKLLEGWQGAVSPLCPPMHAHVSALAMCLKGGRFFRA